MDTHGRTPGWSPGCPPTCADVHASQRSLGAAGPEPAERSDSPESRWPHARIAGKNLYVAAERTWQVVFVLRNHHPGFGLENLGQPGPRRVAWVGVERDSWTGGLEDRRTSTSCASLEPISRAGTRARFLERCHDIAT